MRLGSALRRPPHALLDHDRERTDNAPSVEQANPASGSSIAVSDVSLPGVHRLEPLARFPLVSRELLASRALLKRTDTKYVLGLQQLEALLPRLIGDYGVLLANGERVARYRSLYFDTPDLRCLRDHHRGRRPRHKVRIRHYLDRGLTYLEIKKKTNANKTDKRRRKIGFLAGWLSSEERRFVDEHLPLGASALIPSAWTNFRRITLVGLHTMERVTIDMDLSFEGDGESAALPGVVIAEVKQESFQPRSPIVLALRSSGIRPLSLSKYCTAAALLFENIRMPRFVPKLRGVRKVQHA